MSLSEHHPISIRRRAERRPVVQPRLRIGLVDDPAEREAERVAEQVMRMPTPGENMYRVMLDNLNFSRAKRLNDYYSNNPPVSGWPYRESYNQLWNASKFDEFAIEIAKFQSIHNVEPIDGVLGPLTANILRNTAEHPYVISYPQTPTLSSSTPLLGLPNLDEVAGYLLNKPPRYQHLKPSFILTIERSRMMHFVDPDKGYLSNAFTSGPDSWPKIWWEALDRFGLAELNALTMVFERSTDVDSGLLWKYIALIKNTWWTTSQGFAFEALQGLDIHLDHHTCFCRESELGQVFSGGYHPGAVCWREMFRGGREGLHICLGHNGQADIHVDKHQVAGDHKNFDGTCVYVPSAVAQHANDLSGRAQFNVWNYYDHLLKEIITYKNSLPDYCDQTFFERCQQLIDDMYKADMRGLAAQAFRGEERAEGMMSRFRIRYQKLRATENSYCHPNASYIQPRLRIGPVDDPAEREAERVDDAVMRMSAPVLQRAPVIIHRCAKCGAPAKIEDMCPSCAARAREEALLRRDAASSYVSEVTQEVEASIVAMRGGGQPLEADVLAFMEPRFGHNFSQVRVHTDTRAARTAADVGALAFTVGSDIAFGTGQYRPRTDTGRRLIAHELTHVVQQNSLVRPRPVTQLLNRLDSGSGSIAISNAIPVSSLWKSASNYEGGVGKAAVVVQVAVGMNHGQNIKL